MPIYTFKCCDCGFEEDRIVPFDTDRITCSSCTREMHSVRENLFAPFNWSMEGNTGAQKEG